MSIEELTRKAREIVALIDGVTGNSRENAVLAILNDVNEHGQLDNLLSVLREANAYDALFHKFQGAEFEGLLNVLGAGLTTTEERAKLLDKLSSNHRFRRRIRAATEPMFRAAERDGNLGELLKTITKEEIEQFEKRGMLAILRKPMIPSGDSPVPGGRVIGPMDLTEVAERSLIRGNDHKSVLLPYGGYDPTADPVIIVHGMQGKPAELKKIIDEFAGDERKQVYVFFYSDRKRSIDRSGDELALQIEALRVNYLVNKNPKVTIIAHSMGGIVSQAALNSMTKPDWLEKSYESPGLRESVIDEFDRVRLIALDTPWAGGMKHRRITPGRARRKGRRAFMDMIPRSRLMRRLDKVERDEGVSVHHIEAADKSQKDPHAMYYRGLNELDTEQQIVLRNFVLADEKQADEIMKRLAAEDSTLLNQLLALRRSEHFKPLKDALERESKFGTVTAYSVGQWIRAIVPTVSGDHATMLDNPDLLEKLEELDE